MMAFQKFKEIEKLGDEVTKHREWLKDHEGLNYSMAFEGKHKRFWQQQKLEYSNKSFSTEINTIARLPNRAIIEYDGDPDKAKKDLDLTEKKLIHLGLGHIRSTHKGKSDYLWVEFNRPMKDHEIKNFLIWISPEGSNVDLNFASSNKLFQVLYAIHWKHSNSREKPIKFFEGKQIDYDNLNIPKVDYKPQIEIKNGFEYETYSKTKHESNKLELKTFKDFRKIKKNKDYVVQDFLYPNTIIMLYSPPKQYKTLLCYSLCIAIANGKEWLNMQCKKNAVLYLDGENNDSTIKDRWEKIHKGMNIKRLSYPLYHSRGGILINEKKQVNIGFLEVLEHTIEKNNIKVLVFDTMHRFCYYEENKSDDINKLYNLILKPLKDKFNLTIIFLHHTTKNGDFRGSGDFIGMVDSSFKVFKDGKTRFRIVNEASRNQEVEAISGEIDFQEDYIKLNRLDEKVESEHKTKKIIEVTENIKSLFKDDTRLKRKEIIERFDLNKWDYEIKTIDRALKYLKEIKYFDSMGGLYFLIKR